VDHLVKVVLTMYALASCMALGARESSGENKACISSLCSRKLNVHGLLFEPIAYCAWGQPFCLSLPILIRVYMQSSPWQLLILLGTEEGQTGSLQVGGL
jgi:hypothetical protein